MFSFPVTAIIRHDDRIESLKVSVAIDEVAVVKRLLDSTDTSDVQYATLLIPLTEIVFVDGRRLPVLEAPADVLKYLDAYRQLEGFYTTPRPVDVEEVVQQGTVIPLFKTGHTCVTSEASIPD